MKSDSVGGLCLLALLLLTIALTVLFAVPNKVSYEGVQIETAYASTTTKEEVAPARETVKAGTLPEMPQVLLDIAWCESRDNQSKVGLNYRTRTITLADGSTTNEKYVWSRDIGRWQINEYYHAEEAKRLGFDIYTEEGNALYALRLYNSNGTRDWTASKPCWSDIAAWKAREQSYY